MKRMSEFKAEMAALMEKYNMWIDVYEDGEAMDISIGGNIDENGDQVDIEFFTVYRNHLRRSDFIEL